MAKLTGRDWKAFYGGTSGTTDLITSYGSGAPVGVAAWVEMDNITNVRVNTSRDRIEADVRGNSGFKSYLTGLKDATIEFEMIYDPTDADFAHFQAYWDSGAELSFAETAKDGNDQSDPEDAGVKGFAGNWLVQQFEMNNALSDASRVSVTLVASSQTSLLNVTA